ncbi:MAG TPA: PQQ-dependent sugar dehydrogenase [Nitrososphaeraceae archaeon]|nr:PQQ-dependent sugar dehydrogenase [Nitrososphaeraceae archaeon]
MRYSDEDNYIGIRPLKSVRSFAINFIICVLTFALLVTIVDVLDNYTAAAFSRAYFESNYDFSSTATITKVQLPGIIPYNNDHSPLSNPPSPFDLANTSNTSGKNSNNNNNRNNPPPPPLTHNTRARPSLTGPTLNDPNVKVEQIIERGLDDPTSMAFLGPNDILLLEKNTGKVHRIVNGKVLPEPVLDVNVANQAERGLLGIAIANNNNDNGSTENGNIRHVFLYYTESGGGKDGDDAPVSKVTPTSTATDTDNATTTTTTTNAGTRGLDTVLPAGNRLYRYDLDLNNNNNSNNSNNSKLTNPLLLLNLPASPPPQRAGTEKNHNGGKVLIGPDNNVYVGIGDVGGHRGQSENNPNGIAPDGTGGILRVTQDGQIVDNPPLGTDTIPLSLYYAYGMRNTFGMDFDPLTGDLWDTENGNTFGDEINLVKPGFNSGWSQVAGIWEAGSKPGPVIGADSNNPPKDLVTFDGKGVYRAPELATLQTIAPTALKFLNSDRLGKQYENTMFVGDVDYGRLYNFKLNEDRTGLVLDGPLVDKVANTPDEMTKQAGVTIGQGFGVITDMQVGPEDGYLYILTLNGIIYRIVPSS